MNYPDSKLPFEEVQSQMPYTKKYLFLVAAMNGQQARNGHEILGLHACVLLVRHRLTFCVYHRAAHHNAMAFCCLT